MNSGEGTIEVLSPGLQTTVQDWPGRTGLWRVGVPPSGPMDDHSFRLGNWALGNPEGAPGLECTLIGPRLRFASVARVMITGADSRPLLDGDQVPSWEPLDVGPGSVLDLGELAGPGLRAYLLVAGGIEVPSFLGSAATFTLGRFGGHEGRSLASGDVLRIGEAPAAAAHPVAVPVDRRPSLTDAWQVAVAEGPHGDPEFVTPADVTDLYSARWEVHFNSARTGIRLIGPKPRWSRRDGGEAGLHPSNIHDTPYTVGAVDFTGDMPILLGPDGPSLGGFVCPATVVAEERWKLGQMRPGDTVRFVRVGEGFAAGRPAARRIHDGGLMARREAGEDRPAVIYRRAGDDHLLIEFQPNILDLALRLRIRLLAESIETEQINGVLELTPGIRALQLRLDPAVISPREAVALIGRLEERLPASHDVRVPSRTVHLPLSWDDPATREAIARYMSGVRSDAPWCPWNIEFIRRINGLGSVEDVRKIVFGAEYMVLGLGDVYLGAPVATPLDPRHRLVTTKYNPARTWTPENAVGIGGAYLCIYGMEGPGGYQFVGRTTQVWSNLETSPFAGGEPWLLREFDRIRWYPVEDEELLDLRQRTARGQVEIEIEEGEFRLAEHEAFLNREADSVAAFREGQQAAFASEREGWDLAGEFSRGEAE